MKVTPQELAERIASGEVRDSYTITAAMLAQLAGFLPPLVLGNTKDDETPAT